MHFFIQYFFFVLIQLKDLFLDKSHHVIDFFSFYTQSYFTYNFVEELKYESHWIFPYEVV